MHFTVRNDLVSSVTLELKQDYHALFGLQLFNLLWIQQLFLLLLTIFCSVLLYMKQEIS